VVGRVLSLGTAVFPLVLGRLASLVADHDVGVGVGDAVGVPPAVFGAAPGLGGVR
jgi:hypothetical protein